MNKIAALFFDLDGTLVDSNDLHVDAWDRAFREPGHQFPPEIIHGQVGKGGDNLVPSLLPDLGEEEQDAIDRRHGDIYKSELMGRVKPFAGARDLLEHARNQGLQVVLASSASGEEVDHYLELLDAAELVSFTTSKDDVGSSKPAPDIFQAALDKAGLRPEQALVIGDTPYDVLAAGRCGVASIAVLSGGFPEEELRSAGATAIYRDAAELLARWNDLPVARPADAGSN